MLHSVLSALHVLAIVLRNAREGADDFRLCQQQIRCDKDSAAEQVLFKQDQPRSQLERNRTDGTNWLSWTDGSIGTGRRSIRIDGTKRTSGSYRTDRPYRSDRPNGTHRADGTHRTNWKYRTEGSYRSVGGRASGY